MPKGNGQNAKKQSNFATKLAETKAAEKERDKEAAKERAKAAAQKARDEFEVVDDNSFGVEAVDDGNNKPKDPKNAKLNAAEKDRKKADEAEKDGWELV